MKSVLPFPSFLHWRLRNVDRGRILLTRSRWMPKPNTGIFEGGKGWKYANLLKKDPKGPFFCQLGIWLRKIRIRITYRTWSGSKLSSPLLLHNMRSSALIVNLENELPTFSVVELEKSGESIREFSGIEASRPGVNTTQFILKLFYEMFKKNYQYNPISI